MKSAKGVSGLFVLAGAYDAILGGAFLLFAKKLFELTNVTLPNHLGYVQFPAALLIIFGVMFFVIAKDPVANRNLIPYGIMLKISYCATVFFYWFTSGIPIIWKPFAVVDMLFLVAFIAVFQLLGKQGQQSS